MMFGKMLEATKVEARTLEATMLEATMLKARTLEETMLKATTMLGRMLGKAKRETMVQETAVCLSGCGQASRRKQCQICHEGLCGLVCRGQRNLLFE